MENSLWKIKKKWFKKVDKFLSYLVEREEKSRFEKFDFKVLKAKTKWIFFIPLNFMSNPYLISILTLSSLKNFQKSSICLATWGEWPLKISIKKNNTFYMETTH